MSVLVQLCNSDSDKSNNECDQMLKQRTSTTDSGDDEECVKYLFM